MLWKKLIICVHVLVSKESELLLSELCYLSFISGIMNYVRLQCLGSQIHLKTKFGSGYQLKFHCIPGKVGDVERFIQTNIRSVRNLESYAGNNTIYVVQ